MLALPLAIQTRGGGWIGFRTNCSRARETMIEKSEEMEKIIESHLNHCRIAACLAVGIVALSMEQSPGQWPAKTV